MKKELPHYYVRDRMAKAFEGKGVAVRKKTDKPIPGEPFMSMADAAYTAASVAQVLVNEQIKELRMERVLATGMVVTGLTAVGAGILYFLDLPVLSETAVSWTIVVAIIATVGFAINLIARGIWDSE